MEGRRVNVLIDHRGVLRRAFSMRVGAKDSSIYIHPASQQGIYQYGVATFPAGETEYTFNTSSGYESSRPLHVSIKESGRVHIRPRGGGLTAGPVQGVPLTFLRGHHFATVTATRVETFKPYERDKTLDRGEFDQVITGDAEVPSVHYASTRMGKSQGSTKIGSRSR